MTDKFLINNRAFTTLNGAHDDTTTTINVNPGDGTLFPSPGANEHFAITIQKSDGTAEVCYCTGRSVDALTVVRGQETALGAPAAQTYVGGEAVELRVTAGLLTEFSQKTVAETISGEKDFTGGVKIGGTLLTSTAAELNNIDGATGMSSTGNKIDAIDTGTLAVWQQTAAPTGWTKETTHNDKSLRVVSGAAGSGGATAFNSVFGSGKVVGARSLSVAQLAAHTHAILVRTTSDSSTSVAIQDLYNTAWSTSYSGSQGSGNTHDHTLSLDLQYVDLIIASKDA